MSAIKLTVRGKTYPVEVNSMGKFSVYLEGEDGERTLQEDTLKGLEQKLTAATRVRSARVALKFKRLGHKTDYGRRNGYSYRPSDDDGPWQVIEITVRGVNEHTGHLMVTWPDGTKGDDESVGRYRNNNEHIYFPTTMADEEILKRRKLIDDTEKWFETNAVDVMSKAKAAVTKALGE